MLPKPVENLILQYVQEMHDVMDLPDIRAIRRLIRRSNEYVLQCLGFVLDLGAHDLFRIRYQIGLDADFIFYFRLSPINRLRLISLIERGVVNNMPTSFLVWMFVFRTPNLINYPRFRKLFCGSLLCSLLSRLRSLHSIF